MSVFPSITLTLCLLSAPLWAASYDSFTEPNQEIALASPELDVLASLKVKEGDKVKKGQMVAALDNSVLDAALAVAKARKNATGQLKAAKSIAKLRKEKVDRLVPLLARGSAQQYEVSEARIELEAANAEIQAAQDVITENSLEYNRLQAQIERRRLRSPIDGVVTHIMRDPAELVGGNQAEIMMIASLNPLQVTVHVPTVEVLQLKEGQGVTVQFPELGFPSQSGKITFISPVTEASSDTVPVKVQFSNADYAIRSGVKCVVNTDAVN